MAESKVAPLVQHSAEFRSRRRLNWILAGTMYAFFYMARYNFSAINALLADRFGWTNSDLGLFSSVGALVYGLSVFLNGPLADRIGGRRAILIGAGGTAIFNVLFGLGNFFLVAPAVWEGEGKARHVVEAAHLGGVSGGTLLAGFLVIWGLNFYFQSFGALSIVKINVSWFHVRERGTFAGIFGILIRLGLLLAFEGVPRIVKALPWQWGFWVPAACIGALFVACFLFVQNTPRDAGLGDFDTGDAVPAGETAGPARLGVVLKKVFASSTMWTIALGSMMIGFVRRSVVDDWWSKYFVNVHHANAAKLSDFTPYLVAARGIAIAGIAGGIVFGAMSDRIFGGRRAPVIVMGFLAQAAILLCFGLLDRADAGPMAAASSLIALSFFVNGAHGMIGGAASMDFGGKKAAATAAGLFDGMQYLAGAVVGVGMGKLLDAYGWGFWQFAPIPFALIGALLMRRLWRVMPGSHHGAAPIGDAKTIEEPKPAVEGS